MISSFENFNLSNYADDNTLYSSGNYLEKVKQTLRQDFGKVTKWFYENNMVLNSGKCHFAILSFCYFVILSFFHFVKCHSVSDRIQ